jgi:hypothetical protein
MRFPPIAPDVAQRSAMVGERPAIRHIQLFRLFPATFALMKFIDIQRNLTSL